MDALLVEKYLMGAKIVNVEYALTGIITALEVEKEGKIYRVTFSTVMKVERPEYRECPICHGIGEYRGSMCSKCLGMGVVRA